METTQRLTRLDTHRAATAAFQLVTPDKAKAWLAQGSRNRSLTPVVVETYARAMQRGDWRDYHPDPVILTSQGALLNGQHRLTALVKTGKSYYMLIVQYSNDDYSLGLEFTLDRGKRRSTRDVLTLGTGKPITTIMAAVARHLFYGIQASSRVIPDTDFVAFYRQHEPAMADAVRLLSPSRKRVTLAPVIAACARALVSVDSSEVARFAQVLLSGESLNEREHSIVRLRNWLLVERQGGLNAAAAADVYARTTMVLKAYVERRTLPTPVPSKAELFPLEVPA